MRSLPIQPQPVSALANIPYSCPGAPASCSPLACPEPQARRAGAAPRTGGDWGSIISAQLARDFPERCRAIHINLVFAGPCYTNPLHLAQLANLAHPWLRRFPVFLSRDEIKSVEDGRHFQQHETGTAPPGLGLCAGSHS